MHLIRSSLKYVPRREREQVARDLKPIYTAMDADQAQVELETFDEKWGRGSRSSPRQWLNAWEHVIPFLAFPAEVRRVIYTTDESVKVPAQFSWPWSCRSPVLVAEVGGCEVSLAGRDAGETRSGWGVGRVRACVILASQDAVGQQGFVLGLGFAQGVVDP